MTVRIFVDKIAQYFQVSVLVKLFGCHEQINQRLVFCIWQCFLDPDSVQCTIRERQSRNFKRLTVGSTDSIAFFTFWCCVLLNHSHNFTISIHNRTADHLFIGLQLNGIVEMLTDTICRCYSTSLTNRFLLSRVR